MVNEGKATIDLKIRLLIHWIKHNFKILTNTEFIKEYFENEEKEELGDKGKGKDKKG